MRVKQVMSSPVVTVMPQTPVKEVAAILVARGISAVPGVVRRPQLMRQEPLDPKVPLS